MSDLIKNKNRNNMAKFDHDDLINIFNLSGVTGEIRKEALRVADMLAKEKDAEKEQSKLPKTKKEYTVVLLTNDDIDVNNIAASVFQIEEGTDPVTLLSSLKAGAVNYNVARKKKKAITSFSDIIAFLRPKWLKDQKVKILTREYVGVQVIKPDQDAAFLLPAGTKEEDFS